MFKEWFQSIVAGLFLSLPLASCTYMSQSGPVKSKFDAESTDYQLINIHSKADLPPQGRTYGVGEVPPRVKGNSYSEKVRARDMLLFVITDMSEVSPFYSKGEVFRYGPLEVPEDGMISVPYIGEVDVMDESLSKLSSDLAERVKTISNTAQISVSRSGRLPRTANVIGEVKNPGPIPLEKSGITSLDLLAASGGPTQQEHLYKFVVRRNERDYTFDFQGFRKKSFLVEEGDLLSVTTDTSNRFYVMGAINKPTIIPFPVPSPTLADALATASGFDERRSDPSGVFVFRKGNPDLVYTLNLKEPSSVLLAQRFAIRGEDIVYVTEAPLVRWSRLISQIMPLTQGAYNVDRVNR